MSDAERETVEGAERVLNGWRIRGDHVAIHVEHLRRLIALAKRRKPRAKKRGDHG
jgi:hypothetical protein